MLRTIKIAVLILGVMMSATSTSAVASDESETKPMPLEAAVAEFNRRAAAYASHFEMAAPRSPKLSKEKCPSALSVKELIGAIQRWVPEKTLDDQFVEGIRMIAKTQQLPPQATLEFTSQWLPAAEGSDVEYRIWWIDLVYQKGHRGYSLRIRDSRLDERRALSPSPGFQWVIEPLPPALKTTGSGLLVAYERDQGGGLVAIVARPLNAYRNLAAVAFDAAGKRFSLQRRTIATHGDSVMERFVLETAMLPYEKIAFLGFEAIDPAGLELRSRAAIRRAKSQGIEVLPLPQVDRPYEFTLTTTTGRALRSSELKGNVVLIECWTTWCGPCKKLVPTLKDYDAKWRDQGLVIIGVNLDEEPQKAEAAHKRDECPWPLVIVPGGDARQLWTDASRIESVPRLLLIDANGILIKDYDTAPPDLSTVIAEAMTNKKGNRKGPEKK